MSWSAAVYLRLHAGISMARAQLPFERPEAGRHPQQRICLPAIAACATRSSRMRRRARVPNLAGVYMRKAGTLPGFRYSPGFAQADFAWDDAHLDAWLATRRN